eukprot:SAG31_NODE_8160_length_1505_cov_4.819474_2_plen_35_part_01
MYCNRHNTPPEFVNSTVAEHREADPDADPSEAWNQ